jgi:hypothetical protein
MLHLFCHDHGLCEYELCICLLRYLGQLVSLQTVPIVARFSSQADLEMLLGIGSAAFRLAPPALWIWSTLCQNFEFPVLSVLEKEHCGRKQYLR